MTKHVGRQTRLHGRRIAVWSLSLAMVLAMSAGTAGAQPLVTETDLGQLRPGDYTEALAINDSGQVVGYGYGGSSGANPIHPFSWTAAGGMIDLGTLGGTDAMAVAVNARGEVIGWSQLTGDTTVHAFLWTATGGMVDLGTLGGSWTIAYAINDSGQVVGWSQRAGSTVLRAFSWTAAGGMVDPGRWGGPAAPRTE
jgi:probable HAF family extracellular repeat protein